MRRSGCSFHLRTEGIISAPVSQYGSGQTRAGLNETASSFTINDGTFVDSQNRGCWWTPPALVLQCDVGQIPETGFSIGCDGTVSYNGQSTFYSCDTGADGLYMIYSAPNGSQCGEITLIADSCYPNTCNGTGTATPSGSSSTGSLPLGSGTPSSQLTGSTSAGSSYPGETGTASSASSGTGTGTDTLPLASLTSFGVFPYPTESASTPTNGGNTPSGGASGSSYPGESTPTGGSASTYPGESAPGSETTPTNSGGGNTQTYPVGSMPGSESTSTYPGGEGTATYPGSVESTPTGGSASTYLGGSTPGSESTATGGSTPTAGESTLTYPVGSTPASESTATYPGGESTPTGGSTSPGGSYPVGSSTGNTPATSSYPGGSYPVGSSTGSSATDSSATDSSATESTPASSSYPGGSYPVGSSTGSSSAGSTPASGYPTNSYPGTSTSSSASSSTGTPGPGESCPGYLSGAYQYPHLIIPVDSSNADSAPGTSYFGEVTSTVSSAFNFDIPQSASGKTCNLVFYFPTQSQLETSSYNFTGSGVVDFSRLSTAVTASTSYSSLPSVSKSYGEQTLAPGSGYDITSFPCPAGEAIAFEISAAEGDTSTNFRYFQDWNPCPLGLFITMS
ncbi:hypothetical protein E0Z10_g10544 [Xylaria hypoxylon]|uniref:Uncharacterized protein n=1 Tax=Xylaria hypoxylon TaxID=37992 RepID=A0A4Z0Y2Q3_9PEZI|nr:hypothetical protein E0Z10_g10544 [Xylaria hypoxylon]